MNDIEVVIEENFPNNLKDKFTVTHNLSEYDSEAGWVKINYTFIPNDVKKNPPVYVADVTHFSNKLTSPALGEKLTLKRLY